MNRYRKGFLMEKTPTDCGDPGANIASFGSVSASGNRNVMLGEVDWIGVYPPTLKDDDHHTVVKGIDEPKGSPHYSPGSPSTSGLQYPSYYFGPYSPISSSDVSDDESSNDGDSSSKLSSDSEERSADSSISTSNSGSPVNEHAYANVSSPLQSSVPASSSRHAVQNECTSSTGGPQIAPDNAHIEDQPGSDQPDSTKHNSPTFNRVVYTQEQDDALWEIFKTEGPYATRQRNSAERIGEQVHLNSSDVLRWFRRARARFRTRLCREALDAFSSSKPHHSLESSNPLVQWEMKQMDYRRRAGSMPIDNEMHLRPALVEALQKREHTEVTEDDAPQPKAARFDVVSMTFEGLSTEDLVINVD